VIHVTRTFIVDKPADVVVGYLADFGSAVDWDPGTESCERQDSAPVQVGSTWRNVSKFLGRETVLDYRLVALEPDHVTLVGRNKTAISTDDITVKDAPRTPVRSATGPASSCAGSPGWANRSSRRRWSAWATPPPARYSRPSPPSDAVMW
jgi:Polyketide cyclase / dehydrase and lipid transport